MTVEQIREEYYKDMYKDNQPLINYDDWLEQFCISISDERDKYKKIYNEQVREE